MNRIDHHNAAVRPARGGFRLDRIDNRLAGVCGGIANYFGISALWVRIGFVAGTIIGFGSLVLIYLAIWLLAD